jgi:hypothetical protein
MNQVLIVKIVKIPYSCDFGHESLQEQACGLKYHAGSRLGHVLYNYAYFLASNEGWTLEKIDQWQKGKPVYDSASGTIFYISISKEANINFMYITHYIMMSQSL